MSSRQGIEHFTQTTQPTADMQVGDEWFDTSTNRLYKYMVQDGTSLRWIEIFNATSSSAYVGPSQQLYYFLQSGFTGVNSTGVQGIFGPGRSGLLGVGVSLTADTVYQMEMNITFIKTAGATSHTMSLAFAGTAGLNFIYYQAVEYDGNGGMNTRFASIGGSAINTASSTAITGAMTATTQFLTVMVKGIVSVRSAGTFIPQYNLSAAPGGAYTTQPGSYITLTAIPSSIGTWA